MQLAARLAAFALGTPLAAVAAVLVLAPPRVDLVVVNGTHGPVVVSVGDRPAARLEAGAALPFEGLVAGRARLVAREPAEARGVAGLVLDDLEGDLLAGLGAPRPTYVWDVAAASSFVVVSKGYGDRKDERGAAPFEPGGRRLFALPAGFIPGVDPAFPETTQVARGATGALRQALWTRGHADEVGKAEVILIVDNGVGANLRLELDGAAQGRVPGGRAFTLAGVPPGRYRLRAVEVRPDGTDSPTVHTLDADLRAEPFAPPAAWVWNVAGARREYHVQWRAYGGATEAAPPASTFPAPGELFRLPDDFFPGIDVPLPERWRRAGVLRSLWTPLGLKRGKVPSALGADAIERLLQPPTPAEGTPLPPAPPPPEESPFPPAPPAPR